MDDKFKDSAIELLMPCPICEGFKYLWENICDCCKRYKNHPQKERERYKKRTVYFEENK